MCSRNTRPLASVPPHALPSASSITVHLSNGKSIDPSIPSPYPLICPVHRSHTTYATVLAAKLTTPHSQKLKRLDRCAASATDVTVGRASVELGRGLVRLGRIRSYGTKYKKECRRSCGALNFLVDYSLLPTLVLFFVCSCVSSLLHLNLYFCYRFP